VVSLEIKNNNFFIITIKNHERSVFLAKRCKESCLNFEINPVFWDAFYVASNSITNPNESLEYKFADLLEIKNFGLSLSSISAVKSHFSLWIHCLLLNEPIVIFEHDAIVVKKITKHISENSIQYLGNKEQHENNNLDNLFFTGLYNNDRVLEHGYSFMRGAHAYSIDPIISKKLISNVLINGIRKPLDMIIEKDLFTILQDDVYAYELEDKEKTILYPTVMTY
jgi:GR25 family glycosyltransferase involved in LPS biosynthesis